MEVEIPDAGWLNGPTQLLLVHEFSLCLYKAIIAHARAAAEAAAHNERELIGAGQYI